MILRLSFLLFLLFKSTFLFTQYTGIAPIPEPVSNNAVVAAQVDGKNYVYSFCGIDETRVWSGIHLKSWRYDVEHDEWMTLPEVPAPNGGKIAAGASFVNGKIYVIGGYHVAQNGTETSSRKVHVFDPMTNEWMPDAAQTILPIDDHIQGVWRDSLIYVVTGWSNNNNVFNVQIFDPVKNEWKPGIPVPNTEEYKVFGGSGVIVGDTIFYAGGARYGTDFPPTDFFRKGVINPNDPQQIEWSGFSSTSAAGYRMGAAVHEAQPVWLGGSDVTYNFDGIAYNGSGGVEPLSRITVYQPETGNFFQSMDQMPAVMDLRGAAQISNNEVILAGGMIEGQQVTDQVWRIRLDNLSDVTAIENNPLLFRVYPNPVHHTITIETAGRFETEIYHENGQLVYYGDGIDKLTVSMQDIANGVYWVNVNRHDGRRGVDKIVIQK